MGMPQESSSSVLRRRNHDNSNDARSSLFPAIHTRPCDAKGAPHGAPLRLLVPVKIGLKNVKAITRITYVAEEPRDYWAERGYSRYDGI
jgi:hypothetical protein